MKKWLISLGILLFISSCANIQFENQEKKGKNPIILDIKEADCCIGCGVNECEKVVCPYECCSGDLFQVLECPEEKTCQDNKCIEQEIEAIENNSDISTIIYVLPEEVKSGGYIEVIVLPGNEGYKRRLNFYNYKGNKVGNYNIRCGKVSYECFVKVRQGYKTSDFWKPGKYHAEVIDIETEKPARAYFNVVE